MNTKRVGPGMYDGVANFDGITVHIDPINRPRTEGSDNVMAIFWEEQPMWWGFVSSAIKSTVQKLNAPIDFLDVGTGSGVMSILACKHASAKNIIAIDKSPRAIEVARENAKRNDVAFPVRNEFYNMGTAPYRSAKVISLNAPYHPYPAEIEMDIPQHARGGIDGQQIFREQLAVANYHLAEGGIISFHQMCLGRNGRPQFVEYIPQLVEGVSLMYTNIFPPIKSSDFFKEVYGDRFLTYQNEMSAKYPEMYFCNGIITRDSKGEVREVAHNVETNGRSWKDRIELHQQIAAHGLK